MALARLLNQPLIIQSVSTSSKDEYGDQIKTDGAQTNVVGYLELTQSIEHLLDRDVTVSNWQAYFPAGTVISKMDYVIFNAQKFQVDGEPWNVYNPRTRLISHILCKLVVVNA